MIDFALCILLDMLTSIYAELASLETLVHLLGRRTYSPQRNLLFFSSVRLTPSDRERPKYVKRSSCTHSFAILGRLLCRSDNMGYAYMHQHTAIFLIN